MAFGDSRAELERHYDAVLPMQWVLHGLGIATAALAASRLPSKNRWISACLGFLWAWMGLAYHLAQFARVNPTFGAPCPATLLTLSILSIANGRGSGLLLAIRFWAAIGGSAAFLLDVPQDLGLIVAALLVLAVKARPRPAAN